MSSGDAAGERALLNTLYRTVGEGLGRIASLILFVFAGRELGESGLGAFVFATAFLAFVVVPMDLGLDRYMLRRVAERMSARDELFWNIFGLKLAIAPPLFAAGFAIVALVGYDHEAQATAWALAPGVLCDSLARTQLYLFQAHERAGPPAFADSLQRILSAALGIAALFMGFGVVSVAITYSAGSFIGVAIGFVLMVRTIGVPAVRLAPGTWLGLGKRALPFGAQDVFLMMLYRVGTIILSLMATQAAVGAYGAAYRLFESSMLITYALLGAFSAMYTYLEHDSEPPLQAVFERSIKMAIVLLAPVSVVFVAAGEPLCELVFGPDFDSAGLPLAILGPGVVMLSVVVLATSLMVARGNPMRIVRVTAAMVVLNVALNLILIPPYDASGAAAAMLATLVVYLLIVMKLAAETAGGFRWLTAAAGPVAGAAAMLLAFLPLSGTLPLAFLAGIVAYGVVLVVVERIVAPADVDFVVRLVRRQLGRA
jgi:O-antigen/teichoic acid export membrane protein